MKCPNCEYTGYYPDKPFESFHLPTGETSWGPETGTIIESEEFKKCPLCGMLFGWTETNKFY